jgi:hypothetical protein
VSTTHGADNTPAQGPKPRPPKPSYHFTGDALPPALEYLADEPRFVAWKYFYKGGDKWQKLPINPHTGKAGSVSDLETWGTFAEALACMKRRRKTNEVNGAYRRTNWGVRWGALFQWPGKDRPPPRAPA